MHAKLAAEYLKKGSVTFAIDECLKSLSHDPSSIEVHLMLGGIYSLNNEFDLALNEYEGVLKVDPENDEAAVFKTQVLGEKEQYAEALAFIRKFTSKVTDSAAAWFYLGKLEHHQDHVNEAIRAYRKAIEVRPGFSQASLSLGLIFELNRENKKALEVYEAQMEEKPDLQIAARLVTLYLRDNRNDPALKLLKTMAALDPEDLNTRLRIGLIHLHSGALGEAKGVFEELLKKIPDSDKVHYYLAATLEQEGRWEQAVEHLSKVSADSRLFEDSNLHAAGLYRDRKRIEDAFGVIRSAIQRSPENAGFYIFQASMFEDQKKWKEASGSLADGLKLFPDHHRMRYFYGAILEKLGNTDEAIAQMEKILEAKPDHADALNFVGYTWTVQGVRLKDAEELLKRAIKLKPDNPFILDSYGWNQFMLGKNANALIYLEKAAGLKGD
ncbi:tetratricopeptide repeat protein, partial [bacterium]|nr:tetratricopeptide repeat protein [bacterium]